MIQLKSTPKNKYTSWGSYCGMWHRATVAEEAMYANCHVTAVDLSLTSLAYAKRKSDELNVNNISYLQADILDLHKLDKKFDIIECSGVLHHMDKPLDGWKVLKSLLKPHGLMRIGLYSELARKDIKKIRQASTSCGLTMADLEIKKFRRSLRFSRYRIEGTINGRDFFSLSSFRDLVLCARASFYNSSNSRLYR